MCNFLPAVLDRHLQFLAGCVVPSGWKTYQQNFLISSCKFITQQKQSYQRSNANFWRFQRPTVHHLRTLDGQSGLPSAWWTGIAEDRNFPTVWGLSKTAAMKKYESPSLWYPEIHLPQVFSTIFPSFSHPFAKPGLPYFVSAPEAVMGPQPALRWLQLLQWSMRPSTKLCGRGRHLFIAEVQSAIVLLHSHHPAERPSLQRSNAKCQGQQFDHFDHVLI